MTGSTGIPIIPIELDGVSAHALLPGKEAVRMTDGWIERLEAGGRLSGALIGDGVEGYQYAIDRQKSFNVWNLMLGLAAVLTVAFSVSLYGLTTAGSTGCCRPDSLSFKRRRRRRRRRKRYRSTIA
jgi:hypothetical protein